jgi:hypothetical protein
MAAPEQALREKQTETKKLQVPAHAKLDQPFATVLEDQRSLRNPGNYLLKRRVSIWYIKIPLKVYRNTFDL